MSDTPMQKQTGKQEENGNCVSKEPFSSHHGEEAARMSELFEQEKAWHVSEFGSFAETDSLPLPDLDEKEQHFEKAAFPLDVNFPALEELVGETKTTKGTVFMAAFALTLAQFSADPNVFFTTIDRGCHDAAAKSASCMFVRTLPAAADTAAADTVSNLLQTLWEQNTKTRESKAYSFVDLSHDLGVKDNILFDYQGDLHQFELQTGEASYEENHKENEIPGALLCVQIVENDGTCEVVCTYPGHRYSTVLIENFFASYRTILGEMLEKEAIKDILPSSETQLQQLDSFIPASFDEKIVSRSITDLFHECAGRYPDITAVVYKDCRYTFRELDAATDRLAAVILDRIGDRKSQNQPVVSILISRNENMVIAPLAAMKAGCAYQPLDPAYPAERLNFMVKDAEAALVIEEPVYAGVLCEYEGERLSTDAFAEIFDGPVPSAALPGAKPEDAMVLLYTSGSTGVPKGVILEHRNIASWCSWYSHNLDLNPGDNVACYASFGFDAHMSEMYPALTGGKTLHIIPEEIRLDLIALNRYFEENDVKCTLITTAVATQFATNIEKSSLRYLLTGGEKLASIDPPTDYTLINVYGPTETTIAVTTKMVQERESNIPIGKANETTRLYVVDRNMHRLPVGAPGELIIAGPQVGRGYLGRPDQTSKAFITDPFGCGQEGLFARAYRTGDIVRFRDNGDLEFVGRRDHQVKVHGYRIELKEVESVIREFEGIRDVTVQAYDDPNGGKYIAAFVCSDEQVDIEAMNAFIADRKPSYMVPPVTMQIDEIPYNVNQKVDKKALPEPVFKAKDKKEGTAAPLNVLEKEIKALLSKILGTEDYDITDELTSIGLTSINSIKLAANLYNEYGISMNAFDLLDGASLQTIENQILEKWMNEKGNGAAAAAAKTVQAKEAQDAETLKRAAAGQVDAATDSLMSSPLGFAQQGVYSECLANPESTFYNLDYCIRLPEGTGIAELRDAVSELYEAHPALNSHFASDETQNVIQAELQDSAAEVPVSEIAAEDLSEYKKSFVKPFDLAKGPLARFEIVKSDALYLLMSIHHLAADGASIDILLNELCRALDGEHLEKESFTCYDLANEQQVSKENEAFFDTVMNGVEEASQLIPDVYEQNPAHTEGIISMPTDLLPVMSYAKSKGITPASVYLAATFLAVCRYTCEEQAAIATISSGRSDVRLLDTVGMFVNTLPLAIQLHADETAEEFIRRSAELFTGVIRHEQHPFAAIAARYDFKPQISYAYQVGVLDQYETSLGALEMEELSVDRAKLPIAIQIFGDEKSGGLVQVNYDTSLFSEAFAKGFAKSISHAAAQLIAAEYVKEVSLTDEEDWARLDTYNQPMQLDYDKTDSVVTRFRKIASEFPDKTAAIYKDKSYTYRELDALTDRLAAYIYKRVQNTTGKTDLAETVVSVIISRSEYVFLLPLAILKAGCGYEPLDPSYPKERLNFMVQDAGAALLIAEESLAGLVDDYKGDVLLLSELMEGAAGLTQYELPPAPKAGDLMIMLYTSGSTGTPKGCQIEHGNMVAFAYGSNHEGFYTTDGRTASYASFGFDVCMSDTFCTLLNGATLCVIPEEIRMNLNELADYFNEMGITQVLLTTQVGVQFVQNYPQMDTLRFLVMGGEKLPALNPEQLSYTIINGYGPTENCCGVSLFPIRFWESNVPIGKPMVTIAGYVLDKAGHRLPAGAAGEYCLTGPQVSRGYLNRPDKTAEAYCDSPFNEFRMYHTGDIVRYRENGDVEFVGRKDGQVKIRGFRVETKEIEAVIREYPEIQDVTVQAYSYDNGGKYLAAFIVSHEKVDVADLNQFIKDRKPAYMVPLVTMQLDQIPLTVNQKVDKKALPQPEVKKAEYEAPATKAEEDFCSIFAQILGMEKVGAADDFFEIGGSSISAMRIVVAASQAGYNIVYQNVFEYTTPRTLAAFAGSMESGEGAGGKEKELQKIEFPDPQNGEHNEGQNEEQDETGSGHAADSAAKTAFMNSETSFYGAGTTEIGRDGYDYHAINELLRGNTAEAFRGGRQQEVGDVLLLGATGYLGIHVFRELLEHTDGKIYCLVRAREGKSAGERFQELLKFYFAEDYAEQLGSRIFLIEADATDPKALENFRPVGESITVINCAASVKHFARDNEIEKTNLETVRNLIHWCLDNNARLVHVSTESVFGHPTGGVPRDGLVYDEHMLYVGQIYEDNQYVKSKFLAERLIYEQILNAGLNAKVLRAGNLAPRSTDGHFQINGASNNYMNTLKGFRALGMVPYDVTVTSTEFSPIDKVAEAVLLLSKTPRECVCFMMSNNHRPLMGDVIGGMRAYGCSIRSVENDEFAAALQEALKDPATCDAMRPFMAYSLNEDGQASELELDDLSVSYTAQILARMGFTWPVCGQEYYLKFLTALHGLQD